MKSIALSSLLLVSGIVSAQDTKTSNVYSFSAGEQFGLKSVSTVNTMQFGDSDFYTNSKLSTGRRLLFKTNSISDFNFSKNQNLQFGVRLENEHLYSPGANRTLFDGEMDKHSWDKLRTSAYLAYKFSPDYSLTSELGKSNGNTSGTYFSVGAKAKKYFNRQHQLTANFSVNWNNSRSNLWSQFDKSIGVNNLSSPDKLSFRPELRLGVGWNWEINSKWSLSTGMSARHFLNDANKNPFALQRSSVTVFSVANYRF